MSDSANIRLCVVIGDPVAHSLSPAMHNAAYKALGIGSQYVFQAAKVTPAELGEYIREVKLKNIYMLAVTIPHKETILPYIDRTDMVAKEIGAVNTVINTDGARTGYNTDYAGAMNALKQHTTLAGKNVAVLGSGGTARAIVYGLKRERANVTVCSRNAEKAKKISDTFKSKILSWKELDHVLESDIIINATPIGREGEYFPIISEGIRNSHIVIDINYNKNETPLLTEAKKKGAITIDGLELLLQQGMLQFELYTGLKAPQDAMRNALQTSKINTNAI